MLSYNAERSMFSALAAITHLFFAYQSTAHAQQWRHCLQTWTA